MGKSCLQKGSDSGGDEYEIDTGGACGQGDELLICFGEESRVPIDDPTGDLLVPLPRRVLDQNVSRSGRSGSSRGYRVVVRAANFLHACTFVADRLHGARVHTIRRED